MEHYVIVKAYRRNEQGQEITVDHCRLDTAFSLNQWLVGHWTDQTIHRIECESFYGHGMPVGNLTIEERRSS